MLYTSGIPTQGSRGSRWGDHRLDHVKSVAVEEWLDSIKRAKGTRAKIRNIMSAIFHHAMSAKRERTPDILELAELQLLLSKLSVRERTLALLDAATGLRVSELLALRWCDVEFENLELRVTRSFRWTATWQRIFSAGAVRVFTRRMTITSSPAKPCGVSSPIGPTIS